MSLISPARGTKRKRKDSRQVVAMRPAQLDQLKWREVPFPEHFDDAEGFFGLEEISDVEIDKDQQTGRISYRTVDKVSIPMVDEKQKTSETSSHRTSRGVSEEESDDEWSGFVDPLARQPVRDSSEPQDGALQKLRKIEEQASTVLNKFEVLDAVVEDGRDVSEWQPLQLSAETTASLSRMGFAKPTPIQRSAIPEIMCGSDLIGKASTGSGKTLAFGIPIYEHILQNHETAQDRQNAEIDHEKFLTALIVSPTRELAYQLSSHLSELNRGNDTMSIVTLTGGLSVHKQRRLLTNADVLIGTPGRIWELMNEGDDLRKKTSRLHFFVLDEADRLLSEGHFKELEELINAIDTMQDDRSTLDKQKTRQTLVFSATFQKDLQRKLNSKVKDRSGDLLSNQQSLEYLLKKLDFKDAKPKFIDVSPTARMAENLTESIVECAALEKDLHLYALLLHNSQARTLIFVNSISAVRRLVPFLQSLGLQALALQSQMPQKARLRSVERFSSPSHPSSILIATDVAARGLDIPSVDLIVHYHVPRAADTYIHRSGRTARASKSGSSILLCAPEEVQGVRRLIAKVHVQSSISKSKKDFINTIELDGRVVDRLKHRVSLAKKVTDASLAKEKHNQEDNWLKNAAEELGVDYDSEEFANMEGSKKGRGHGRRKKEKEAREVSKDEAAALRAQLKAELRQRVNVGVSERYLTANGSAMDLDALLEGKDHGSFLGIISGNSV